ncbi:unnamed protein product [Musa textilis]
MTIKLNTIMHGSPYQSVWVYRHMLRWSVSTNWYISPILIPCWTGMYHPGIAVPPKMQYILVWMWIATWTTSFRAVNIRIIDHLILRPKWKLVCVTAG